MNFLPGFGINIYPYGNFLVPIYSLMVTYAILKYQILDINKVVIKSISYSILLTLVTIIYLMAIVFIEKLLQGVMGYQSIFISVLVVFIIGVIFIPLRNRIQYLIDQFFFKGTQVQVAEENERLRQELARSERLKAVSTLASGMAHEIKNPLTALKTFVEFLPEKKNDPQFLESFSKIVGKEVSRIDDLVHQLLEFAKPSPLQLKETDIHLLIVGLFDFLSNNFLKHQIKVTKDFFQKPILLKADPNRLKQALLNILLNAIDAMPKGGTLTILTRGVDHDLFEIIIRDTGHGISPKDLPHIFDPFFTKKDGGTGLGLAITHQIIQEHGGKIAAKSEVEKGTEFTITLKGKND